MMAIIAAVMISYGGGYVHRWLAEPECKTVEVYAPGVYTTPQRLPICKEGIDPITKIDQTCMIPTPRYVLTIKGYKEYVVQIQGQREWLNESG